MIEYCTRRRCRCERSMGEGARGSHASAERIQELNVCIRRSP